MSANSGPVKTNLASTVAVNGVTGTLPIANGGTASTATLNNNRVMKSSGSAIVEAAAITASKALASDANGIPVAATTTAAELDFVSGVTSAIQTQINTKKATFTASQIIRGGGCTKGGSVSGDTTVVNYATAISSTGSDITFTARTTTTGDKYTINTTGIYSISSSIIDPTNGQTYGISINSSGTSTAVQSLAVSESPAIFFTGSGGGNSTVILNLNANDIVRTQTETGGALSSGNTSARFIITRVS